MDWNLILKYLSGECTQKEELIVEEWLDSDVANQSTMDEIKRIWEVKPDNDIKIDASKAWSDFKNDIIEKDKEDNIEVSTETFDSHPPSSGNQVTKVLYYALTAAAVIIIAFLFADEMNKENVQIQNEQFNLQEIVTKKGEKTELKLSDGTRVMLNSDSKLSILPKFSSGSREVWLGGEAYFEVAHNKENPFIVNSKKSSVTVLGTEFIVSAYPENDETTVAVTEGKVAFNSKEDTTNKIIIEKKRLGRFTNAQNIEVQEINNLQEYTGWTTGKLVFQNTPLVDIETKLERWYNISITVEDSALYSRELTATFNKESLSEVLKITSLSLDVAYKKDKHHVTFYTRTDAEE